MKTMYGYDVESIDDPCITNADESITLGAKLFVPGATLINIFPILAFIPAWFPGASSQKLAAEVKRLTAEVIRVPMDWAKMRMVCQVKVLFLFRIFNHWTQSEGTAVPSLVANFLEKKNTIGASAQEERAIADIAYTVYSGKNSFSSTTLLIICANQCWLAAADTVSPNLLLFLDWLILKSAVIDDLCDWQLFLLHGHHPWYSGKSSKRNRSRGRQKSSPWPFRQSEHALCRSDLSRGVTVQTTATSGSYTLPYGRRPL